MMLVYTLTTLIVAAWLFRMVEEKRTIFVPTPLFIPIILFLLSQVISTIISIDPHTSIWGYYSRSNGGLLSTISYTLLYFAAVSNFTKQDIIFLLKMTLFGGALVALYAIPESKYTLNASPSCFLLHGEWTDSCWVQDVQERVFATLGQPNWLAAYLGMLIFPALYFFIRSRKVLEGIYYLTLTLLYYIAFTLTFSRGASIGLAIGLGVFVMLWIYHDLVQKHPKKELLVFSVWVVLAILLATYLGLYLFLPSTLAHFPIPQPVISTLSLLWTGYGVYYLWRGLQAQKLLIILMLFLIANLFFGSALTRFKLISTAPVITKPASPAAVTQLEAGGTESGQIRLIVWKGALRIFRHYPWFGSGVETFAYSYYNFRPVEHNMVSEWDFLYNKAHNEYLNYLATTGAVGFGTYMILILSFIGWSLWRIVKTQKYEVSTALKGKEAERFGAQIKKNKHLTEKTKEEDILKLQRMDPLLLIALLSSYIFYLVQNFFGFSVVIIAVLFYLFPAFAININGSTKLLPLKIPALSKIREVLDALWEARMTQIGAIIATTIVSLLILSTLQKDWRADALFAKGTSYTDAGLPGRGYNYLDDALTLNPNEPFYHSEEGFAAASSAVAALDQDATLSATLKQRADLETKLSLAMSPQNVSYYRTAVRTYYALSQIDPTYNEQTIQMLDKAITLAPTDPKLYYNKALILGQNGQVEQGLASLQKAIQLKPNYLDARMALAQFYTNQKQYDQAIDQYNLVLKLTPGDAEVLKKIKELEELKQAK